MMTLDEVRQVAAEHDIGGHSWDHATMGLESDDYFRDDVARCDAFFRENLGQPMSIYAFPNGSCTPAQLGIARQAGIQHILLVDEDFSAGGDVHHRFTFGAESRAEVRFRATGARRMAA
jgi:peptidoglycan/xylan/chitin deacetylase (PgdA/CDA1 family)